jgi:hypothetical protein
VVGAGRKHERAGEHKLQQHTGEHDTPWHGTPPFAHRPRDEKEHSESHGALQRSEQCDFPLIGPLR